MFLKFIWLAEGDGSMEELISRFFMLRLAKRWNLVLLLLLFISQLLSFVLHLLFLGRQF